MTKGEKTYSVGYGKPPTDKQFVKGRSGNPKGRPRRVRDSDTLALNLQNEKVAFGLPGGRRKLITRREAFVREILHEALLGNSASMKMMVELMQKYDRQSGDVP